MVKSHFSFISCSDIVQVFQSIRVFEIRRTEGGRFSAGLTSLILGGPIVRQTFCCFVCNGFAKHVLWLLISCLTDCLCNLGSKYNGRICPGFIKSKSVNKVIRSRSVTLSLIGGIRGIPLKSITYNLVIADSYQIIELKTSSDQWKLFKGDDVDFPKKRFYFCNRLFIYFTIIKTFYMFWI